MKRVLVHGYLRVNLGDDLFFRALAVRYPDVEFCIPTIRCEYREMFHDLPNVKIIDFLKIAKVTQRKIYTLPKLYSILNMKRFDAVVCIGGSLFIDRKNPSPKDKTETEKYSFISDWEYAEKAGVPYFVLGANWGPCYNDYFYNYFSRAFDSLADLYFRDKASFELFADKSAARQGGDILLGNDLISDAAECAGKKKQIAVSVIDTEKKNCDVRGEKYYRAVARVCDEYIARGYDVKLLSFCKEEGDENACRNVYGYIEKQSNAEMVFYNGNWKAMIKTIGQSEVVLASRFHAAIIGWTLKIPTYAVAYGSKTVNLMEECNMAESYINIVDIELLNTEYIDKNAAFCKDTESLSGAETAFEKLDMLLK